MNNLKVLASGIIKNNPTFVLVLGMCPTLGTTTSAENGFGMGVATMAVLILSNLVISLIKNLIPDKVRIPAFIVVIASFVTIISMLMQAYVPALYASLGVFIPLIVVNCIILARAEAFAAKNGVAAEGTPFQIFSRGVAGFFEKMGVPVQVATVFMTMCVSALALTTLDAVARIGKMSFQEIFSVDDMQHAALWRKVVCNPYFATIITLLCGYVLTKVGYQQIWPLFGSANQLLSALVLITLCVFLKVTGRKNKILFPPMIIMLCVTFTALVQRLIAMIKAIQQAAAVEIPAGQTSWGAVFIANGLQLIIAVLLIVLGLTIVVNSAKSYVKSKKGSETEEVAKA